MTTNMAPKLRKRNICKCGKTSRFPEPEPCATVYTYPTIEPDDWLYKARRYDDEEPSPPQELQKRVCNPVSTKRKSFRPFHLSVLAYPRYERPAGCDVLASYNRVCEDMDNTTCLGFINSRDNEMTWGEFKRHVPLPLGRITHLPARRRIHFNNYFIRKCTPEAAESWKILGPQPLILADECEYCQT